MEDALGDLADDGLWEALYSAEAPPLEGSTIVCMPLADLLFNQITQSLITDPKEAEAIYALLTPGQKEAIAKRDGAQP